MVIEYLLLLLLPFFKNFCHFGIFMGLDICVSFLGCKINSDGLVISSVFVWSCP